MKYIIFFICWNLTDVAFVDVGYSYTIQGIITDADTKAKLQDAKISLERSDGKTFVEYTNELGFYKFEKSVVLENMDFVIIVENENYHRMEFKESTKNRGGSFGLIHDFMIKKITI